MSGDKSQEEKDSNQDQSPRPELKSAGVPWNEVPAWAVPHVEYLDGLSQFQHTDLPDMEAVPVPEILSSLPPLHPDRPRGSKAMLDAGGARKLLANARPGAWTVSPYTGWKWAKWPSGDVGWLPADVALPEPLCLTARKE